MICGYAHIVGAPFSGTEMKKKVMSSVAVPEVRVVQRRTKFVRCVGSERDLGNAIFWPSRCPNSQVDVTTGPAKYLETCKECVRDLLRDLRELRGVHSM